MANPTTLNDVLASRPGRCGIRLPMGRRACAPNETLTISKLLGVVPEPTTAALVIARAWALGLAARRKPLIAHSPPIRKQLFQEQL
jgi:hypothetical protein